MTIRTGKNIILGLNTRLFDVGKSESPKWARAKVKKFSSLGPTLLSVVYSLLPATYAGTSPAALFFPEKERTIDEKKLFFKKNHAL